MSLRTKSGQTAEFPSLLSSLISVLNRVRNQSWRGTLFGCSCRRRLTWPSRAHNGCSDEQRLSHSSSSRKPCLPEKPLIIAAHTHAIRWSPIDHCTKFLTNDHNNLCATCFYDVFHTLWNMSDRLPRKNEAKGIILCGCFIWNIS